MPSGNEVTVSVLSGTTTTVTVPSSTGTTPTITNGGTANVTVTSVGDRGPKGDAGPATTLTIGTVTTGAADSNASATITGSAPNQTLSLTIPRGTAGDAGVNGTFSDAQLINSLTSSYTLALSDAGKLVAVTNDTTAAVLTVPANTSVAFQVGTHIDIARLGIAAVSVVGASGVSVNGTPGLTLRERYSAATLIKINADSWLLVGDLST